ncbi:MAG: DnaJ domain-containing protein [Candidatus Auribacterota bacterium]|nr:DnaJ domain-containing protein [Candidatus Auribacterota bacterium]
MRTIKNYYRILNVGPYASSKAIRSSFRRLAKKYHPDTSKLDPASAAIRMRMLIEAYRILMDSEKRAAYNLRFKPRKIDQIHSYRESLEKRKSDPYSRGLLIFYDLLNGSPATAIFNYEQLLKETPRGGDLLSLLGFADYLDCVFLLAESFQRMKRYEEAVRHYEAVFKEDRKWNYFRNFRPEIKQRIRDIYCRHLARSADPNKAIGYYRILLNNYTFPKKEQAFFYKKIAECYYALGEMKKSKENLSIALNLQPKLTGTKKIIQNLAPSALTLKNKAVENEKR